VLFVSFAPFPSSLLPVGLPETNPIMLQHFREDFYGFLLAMGQSPGCLARSGLC
jgi:hypothetical protein